MPKTIAATDVEVQFTCKRLQKSQLLNPCRTWHPGHDEEDNNLQELAPFRPETEVRAGFLAQFAAKTMKGYCKPIEIVSTSMRPNAVKNVGFPRTADVLEE